MKWQAKFTFVKTKVGKSGHFVTVISPAWESGLVYATGYLERLSMLVAGYVPGVGGEELQRTPRRVGSDSYN